MLLALTSFVGDIYCDYRHSGVNRNDHLGEAPRPLQYWGALQQHEYVGLANMAEKQPEIVEVIRV